ncbi:VanZ family protein [Stutzerimonas nitrititolerans]|uniref:VanZ family protein n=1 Tax=Stutzerimonas nitrititolerans TaxID=2482751 RepID=UPI0028AB5989|nr:VanZ family protein [Stutzerimonas nitrititolerans]
MRFLRFLPFLAVAVVILYAGLKPEPVPQAFDQQDKLHHLLGFAALAFSMRLAFPRLRLLWVIVLCLALAVLVEVGQSYYPHRVASIADMVANALGVAVGCGCSVVARRAVGRWLRRGNAVVVSR